MFVAWISEQTAIISLYSINLPGFKNRSGECLLRGMNWVFKSDRYSFVLKGLIYIYIYFFRSSGKTAGYSMSVCPISLKLTVENTSNVVTYSLALLYTFPVISTAGFLRLRK